MRLLDVDLPAKEGLELTLDRFVEGSEVLHLRYRVEGPSLSITTSTLFI